MTNNPHRTLFQPGDRVRIKESGDIVTIEADFGPRFHPPITVLESGQMYDPSELEAIVPEQGEPPRPRVRRT